MEFHLMSGEIVIDRPDSHLHEDGVSQFLEGAFARMSSENRQFIETQIEFPQSVGKTICVGTSLGDEIVFAKRPKRLGLTRFVKNRLPADCNSITIVLKKGNQGQRPDPYYVLLTAYVGHVTPTEPWDECDFAMRDNPDMARQKAHEFWNNHALIYGTAPMIPGTETTVCPW